MKSKYLTHSGNWSGFLTIQGPSCPTVPQLSTITENATIEEQVLWGHTTCREGLVYCSHITVTSTPLDGNTTPRPHWAAISVFPPGLGLDTSCLLISHSQTKHLYDTLYYLLMGEVRRRGHGWTHCLTYAGKKDGRKGGLPTGMVTETRNSLQTGVRGPESWFFLCICILSVKWKPMWPISERHNEEQNGYDI